MAPKLANIENGETSLVPELSDIWCRLRLWWAGADGALAAVGSNTYVWISLGLLFAVPFRRADAESAVDRLMPARRNDQ